MEFTENDLKSAQALAAIIDKAKYELSAHEVFICSSSISWFVNRLIPGMEEQIKVAAEPPKAKRRYTKSTPEGDKEEQGE